MDIETIERKVLEYFPIAAAAPEMLKDKTRKREYREPRHVIWFIAVECFGIRFTRLGEHHNRTPQTVLKTFGSMSRRLEVDRTYKEKIDQITVELLN